MKLLCLLLITITLTTIHAQDKTLQKAVVDFFGSASTRDPLINMVEMSTKPLEDLRALDKCGEGSQEGTHACVPYYQCDINTNMIIQGGSRNGSGSIDIRLGSNACDHFLDNCCQIPPGMKVPILKIPVDLPVATDKSPVTTVNTPVIPVSPTDPTVTPDTTNEGTSVAPDVPRPSSLFCGLRNSEGIDFKITGNRDNEAEYGEFPWMVALLWKSFDPTRHKTLSFCGGSLIAPNVVLTGAHCIGDDINPNQFKVRAGEWDTQTDKERYPYQERDVVQVLKHEHFRPDTVYNDVALLILSSPFDQADNIGTICLPSQDESITSSNCFASGWGKKVFGAEDKYQVILKKIELPMVQPAACERALRRTRLGQIFQLHPSFICAGGQSGKDTCTGDGGGPLVCPDPKNPNRYVQSGIVSWGIGCGEENIPGVYANVAKFRNWVNNQFSILNINTKPYNV